MILSVFAVLFSVATVALAAQSGPKEVMFCDARFQSNGVLVDAGEEFAFVGWGEVSDLSATDAYEAFMREKVIGWATWGRGARLLWIECKPVTLPDGRTSYAGVKNWNRDPSTTPKLFWDWTLDGTLPETLNTFHDKLPSVLPGSPAQEREVKVDATEATAAAGLDQEDQVAEDSDERTAETVIDAREQREAEFRAKLAAHEASVAEYRREVAEREAEIDRQQREHAAAQEAAAREKAAYEEKMAAHRRELDEANRRQQAYFTAQRRHALCMNGDQAQCAALKDGEAGQLADAGEASTDTDANQCVTTVETKLNATFKGNTSASVINGCGKPVDVRICLMTHKGWNCGDDSAVASQAKATHSSFNATGEVFVDARMTGSKKALNSPR